LGEQVTVLLVVDLDRLAAALACSALSSSLLVQEVEDGLLLIFTSFVAGG
jgi:hypothetical protein